MTEAFKHAKPVGAVGDGVRLLEAAELPGVRLANGGDGVVDDAGVVTTAGGDAGAFAEAFADAIAAHRHFDRELAAVAA